MSIGLEETSLQVKASWGVVTETIFLAVGKRDSDLTLKDVSFGFIDNNTINIVVLTQGMNLRLR